MKKEVQGFKIDKILAHEDEMAYLAALGSVMNMSLKEELLKL